MRRSLAWPALLALASAAAEGDPPKDPADEARMLAEFCDAHPEDGAARLRLGQAWLDAHDPAAADRAFEAVLAKDARNPGALAGRGRAALDLGRWADAARQYTLLVDAAPGWEPVRIRPALMYALTRSGSDRIDAEYERALALPAESQDPVIWSWAVHRAVARREPALAVERANEAIRRFPSSPWGPNALAWAYRRQGKDEEAESAYRLLAKVRAAIAFPPQVTKLALPFEGRWTVLQGPGGEHSHRSHYTADSWDFQALDENGRTHANRGAKNEDWFGFGRPVLAPADGWVVDLQDGLADNEPGQVDAADTSGNFLMLEHAPGEFSRFMHLKKGSLRVKMAQRVRAGEVVAQCGNSGWSSQPHLHFDLCSDRPPADASRPAVFARYVRTRRWEPLDVADGCPQTGEWVEPFKN